MHSFFGWVGDRFANGKKDHNTLIFYPNSRTQSISTLKLNSSLLFNVKSEKLKGRDSSELVSMEALLSLEAENIGSFP